MCRSRGAGRDLEATRELLLIGIDFSRGLRDHNVGIG